MENFQVPFLANLLTWIIWVVVMAGSLILYKNYTKAGEDDE